MIIGVMVIDLLVENSFSLKDKRRVVASLKDRLRKRFNVSIIESDYQNLWKKIQLSVVMASNSPVKLDQDLIKIEEMVFSMYPVQKIHVSREYV